MEGFWAAVRIGLLDMRGDLRRFALLIACLAVGTGLIAGVSSVGAGLKEAIERDAAVLMGGSLELSRSDRLATPEELAVIGGFGQVANVVDTNVRAESGGASAFVDLISVGEAYPLLGEVASPDLPSGTKPFAFLGPVDDQYGALVDPLMLDRLGASVGDVISIGGTPFTVRGILQGIPDGPVRGFRLGSPAVISTDALAILADRTSPLPGLGNVFRYKVLLDAGDPEATKAAVEAALGDTGWTVRSARDGLGPMVRYYDLFMRFLVIVGLASLFIGGVSVWTVISAYVSERAPVIAVLRSLGASGLRVLVHFLSQVSALALIGVGIGLLLGGGGALVALPIVGRSVGVELGGSLHVEPLLVAGGIGLVIAFAFSYLPLQQAQAISPVTLFRSKGVATDSLAGRGWLTLPRLIPVALAAVAFAALAVVMTGDPLLVAGFAGASIVTIGVFWLALFLVRTAIRGLPDRTRGVLRYALRDIVGPGSNASAIVVSVGLALAMLVMVLVFEVNLRNEYLGASAFDAPTFVAADLFDDEVQQLEALSTTDPDVERVSSTPMLRGELTAVNGTPATGLRPRGPAASFLMSGEVPLAYRRELPATSRIVGGEWWPSGYESEPLVSLHEDLRSGLGVNIGDVLTFTIFGDEVTAKVASFRDYSWQGGIDVLVTFSPGVLENYPLTLLGAVTAVPGREDELERTLAADFPDVRFIAIGETLEKITVALNQLSLAASLVGGLAVGNGLLVLIGSLATGRRQRQADAAIMRVLGGRRTQLLAIAVLEHLILATFAALLALPIGIAVAGVLSSMLLTVEFSVPAFALTAVELVAIALCGLLGAETILRALSARPALFLRELTAE